MIADSDRPSVQHPWLARFDLIPHFHRFVGLPSPRRSPKGANRFNERPPKNIGLTPISLTESLRDTAKNPIHYAELRIAGGTPVGKAG
jgi:hypothetical protein